MPIYQYVCTECGKEIELNIPMILRDDKHECLECEGLLKRKWGVGGVVIR